MKYDNEKYKILKFSATFMIFDKAEIALHMCFDMNKLFELLNLLEFILKLNSRCANKI